MKMTKQRTIARTERLSTRGSLLSLIRQGSGALRTLEHIVVPVARRGALRAGTLGLIDQHDGDVILDGEDEPALPVSAVELLAFEPELALAEGAGHDVEQILGDSH